MQATRPQTLLLALAPLLLASMLAAQQGQFASLWLACMAWATVSLQIASNLFNDWADGLEGVDGPERLGPIRAVQAGWLTGQAVFRAGWLAIASGVLAGCLLLWRGGWPIVGIGLLSIAAAYGYTAKPLQLAYRGLGDVAVFVFFGPIAVHGAVYVYTHAWSHKAWLPSIAVGSLATGVLVINHLRDVQSDRAHRKRTLVVRLGLQAGRWQYVLLHVAAWLAALLAHGQNMLPMVLLLPFSLILCGQVSRLEGRALQPYLPMTALYTLLFAGLWSLAGWP